MQPTLTCGDVVLRAQTEADDDLLASLLPDDFDHDPTYPHVPGRTLAEHRDAWLRQWLHNFRHPENPADRYWVFVVEHDGSPVGLQTLEGESFETRREVESSSFLVPEARGKRLGVAMRTAVLAYAFDVLGATRAISAARPDNVASKRVCERVGYRFVERQEPVVAGSSRPVDVYEITLDDWRDLDHLPVEIASTPGVTPSSTDITASPQSSDLTHANRIAADLEDDELARKLRQDRSLPSPLPG